MFIIRLYLEIFWRSFLVAHQFQNNLLTWNTVLKIKMKKKKTTTTLSAASQYFILKCQLFTKQIAKLWTYNFKFDLYQIKLLPMSPSMCFPFRLLSHKNIWGFGFPSQLGTGHFFWNLEFPQDGKKKNCYSAVCIMTRSWISELFFFLDKQAFPRPGVLSFPLLGFGSCISFPCLWQHPSRCRGLSVHGWDGDSWLLVWREGVTQVADYRG